ncbi:MAG: DsrE/DsrF/DrsH-like family protein [Arenicellales bacterium]|nr:DsrE/DsrF/DrsH-like family protein [Arenicellales bacterium]
MLKSWASEYGGLIVGSSGHQLKGGEEMSKPNSKRMALIASKGTLDWAYPPFILASTAAAMDMEVGIFFTFYGLTLLKKKISAKVAPHTNPAMPMKMPFGPKGFQDIEWPIPNALMGNVPGFETMATSLMKKTFQNKGVATIEELRDACIESDVKLIGCQMTMDVFGFDRSDFIDEVDVGGAATFLEFAADADIQLFI